MRRSAIGRFVGLCSALCAIASVGWPSAVTAQTVHEVTIATPNMIAIEVRDAPFVAGGIEPLPVASSQEQGTWIDVGGRWGRVIGPGKNHVRISDTPPSQYLDRARVDDASGYGPIDGAAVKAVYRKSTPYDSGIYRGAQGETMTGASLKHYIYLELSQPLSEGEHAIKWPGGVLPDTAFQYSQRTTRAIALRVNQHGHRASDERKVAFLSLWVPGGADEGAVDFRKFGLDTFDILDEAGKVRFSSKITLRMAPTDPEPGNGLGKPLLDYLSASGPSVEITSLDTRHATTATAPGHKFSKGQRIWLDGFVARNKKFNGFATVGATTADTFELTDLAGGGPSRNSPRPTAFPAHTANRAGTYVFELDYSAWVDAPSGAYRLHVPGLGVSDPFHVRDDIWLAAAQTSIGGLYNHRSGVALDGRFGFSRPAGFRPGPDFAVKISALPLPWTTNSSLGRLAADVGAQAPWITDETAPDSYWGGYMDAGDWDRRIDHLDVSSLMLDVYESAPAAMAVPLKIPKSSEVLDPKLYAEIDDLPDVLHEAVWSIDFFRRLQLADGSVRGGIESGSHPLLGEPSFLEHYTVYAYAPDPISTYRYAAVAAKFAHVLQGLGKTHLADVYRESALRAWSAGAAMRATPVVEAQARKLATANNALDKAGLDQLEKRIQKATDEHRVAASGALYRLTGEDQYRVIFEKAWAGDVELYQHNGDGAWEYYKADFPSADGALKKRIGDAIVAAAQTVAQAQAEMAYPGMKHPFAPLGWGQGLAPDYNQTQMFIRAHQITGDKDLLGTMQNASAQILGANQVGLSFTTGLGLRTIKHPLHEDHRAMGVTVPDGITVYGWASQFTTAHDWIFGPYWSPLPLSGTKEHAEQRRVSPDPFAMPLFDYLIEHPLLVIQQEYTVQQSIGTTAAMWLYLHAAAGRKNP